MIVTDGRTDKGVMHRYFTNNDNCTYNSYNNTVTQFPGMV